MALPLARRRQSLLRRLVTDSSTLIAFEKAGLVGLLPKLSVKILVPQSVKAELEAGSTASLLKIIDVLQLKGRSIKKSRALENVGIGNGEADCCVLAHRLKLGFIVCDDRKFVRQRFLSNDKTLMSLKIFGFSFLLHLLYKRKIISEIWPIFEKILISNNWRRSEVEASNYLFLKKFGY